MSKCPLVVCFLILTAGCSGRPNGEEPAGPGRFPHAAIRETTAPWDGHAIQLLLCENPLKADEPAAPYVSVYLYQGASDLSGQRVRLGERESEKGNTQWVSRPGEGRPLAGAEVEFETIRAGVPVEGKYDLTFPDGKRERGRFPVITAHQNVSVKFLPGP